MDLWKWGRGKAVAVNFVAIVVLSIPCVLGFNVLSGFQPLGPGSVILDLEDFLVSYNLLPLGSLVYLAFCIRRRGWGWENFLAEANTGRGLGFPKWLRGYMTKVLPLIVVIIYCRGYWDLFASKGTVYLLSWSAVAVAFLGFIGWIIFGRAKARR